jgi:hypothetical protein
MSQLYSFFHFSFSGYCTTSRIRNTEGLCQDIDAPIKTISLVRIPRSMCRLYDSFEFFGR